MDKFDSISQYSLDSIEFLINNQYELHSIPV